MPDGHVDVMPPTDGMVARARGHGGIAARLTTRHAVRPSDLDSLGHVNNARVLEYLEYGRWQWLTHFGMSLKASIIPVVVRVEIDYRREIFAGNLAIGTSLGGESFYTIAFDQAVDIDVDGKRRTAASARVSIAFIDRASRKPRRVKDILATLGLESRPPYAIDGQRMLHSTRAAAVMIAPQG